MDTSLFKLIKMAYSVILRPLVVDKIKQSPTQIDDFVLSILDKLFDYDGTGK
jgi:hypothetical protein